MGRGKYLAKSKISPAAWILILIAAISLCSGAVYAYLRTATGPLVNDFTAATDGNPTVSTDATGIGVDVGSPGYAVYVRAAVVVTWQDGSGNVLGQAPVEGTDYEISINESDWFQKDGFYYHKAPVTGETSVLVESCTSSTNGEYHIHVEVVSQTIQALGSTDVTPAVPAVTAAWGVSVDANRNLIP